MRRPLHNVPEVAAKKAKFGFARQQKRKNFPEEDRDSSLTRKNFPEEDDDSSLKRRNSSLLIVVSKS